MFRKCVNDNELLPTNERREISCLTSLPFHVVISGVEYFFVLQFAGKRFMFCSNKLMKKEENIILTTLMQSVLGQLLLWWDSARGSVSQNSNYRELYLLVFILLPLDISKIAAVCLYLEMYTLLSKSPCDSVFTEAVDNLCIRKSAQERQISLSMHRALYLAIQMSFLLHCEYIIILDTNK